MFPYAHFLDSLINASNSCGETMFYMTWGRKNGDASNCASWPPICTYAGMDSLLYMRYMQMADTNNAVVSPVGAVWKYIRQNYPLIELYQSYESHPSLAGSYAAACCFYTCIFRKNPTLITNDCTLPAADAAKIRAAVKTIVFDNLLNWHIGEYDPIADFSFVTSNNNLFTFTNLSGNATSYQWNFGDGDTSTATNPVHTYAMGGNYNVTLIANHCDFSNTISHSVSLITSSNENHSMSNNIQFYPNPVSNQITINLDKVDGIYVVNSIGKACNPSYASNGTSTSIDFSDFATGIYFIIISTNGKLWTQKMIKN